MQQGGILCIRIHRNIAKRIKTYRGLILFALFVYFALQNLSLIWDIAMRLLSILTFLIGEASLLC